MQNGVPKDREPRVGLDHTALADAEANVSAVVVSFEASTQELGPLLDAANRLMSQASCHIDSSMHRYTCRLVPKFADLTGDARSVQQQRVPAARQADQRPRRLTRAS